MLKAAMDECLRTPTFSFTFLIAGTVKCKVKAICAGTRYQPLAKVTLRIKSAKRK
jgi:hypothetical protein